MLIDASHPLPLTPEQVREWAGGRTFFISSAMGDTADERREVAAAVERSGARPVWFEHFGGRDDDAESAYLAEVERSDDYIGIYRVHYGRVNADGISATHAEYRRAEERGKPIAAWVASGIDGRDASLAALIDEVRMRHTTGAYETPSDLGAQVVQRIADLAAEDVSPWVKLGDLVFRATSVRLARGDGRIEARLRPGPVLDAIEAIMDRQRHGRDVLLTVRGRSMPVRVTDVTSTVESGTRTVVVIDLRMSEAPSPTGMAYSNGTVSLTAEETVALRLRNQLFGDAVPGQHFFFWCEFNIDTGPLRETALPDATAVALTRLLVTEALIGGGYIGSIQRIEVSPMRTQGRFVRVAWTDRKIYTNREPASRSVEGFIPR